MKFGMLRAVGHNIAASIAGGPSFLFGIYDLDIFAEANRTPERYIDLDLVAGLCSGSDVSGQLAHLDEVSSNVLRSLCDKHHVDPSAFGALSIRFLAGGPPRRFVVTIQDASGRRATNQYGDGKHPRILDHLGRIRTMRSGIVRDWRAAKYY